GVGDLAAEYEGDVHELDQPDARWFVKDESLTAHHDPSLRYDDFRLALDHQSEGASHGHHGQGLEGRVERQAPHRVFRSTERTYNRTLSRSGGASNGSVTG